MTRIHFGRYKPFAQDTKISDVIVMSKRGAEALLSSQVPFEILINKELAIVTTGHYITPPRRIVTC